MKTEPVEVVGLDSYSGHDFAVYFSDDTYATVTAERLAQCFPERTPISAQEDLVKRTGEHPKKEEGGVGQGG